MELSDDQLRRYDRNIILPGFGLEGQKKLLKSNAIIIGAGGLGSSAGYYLAAAGVGTLGLVDDDAVELSNLQRQIAHSTGRLGAGKAQSARETFTALNPDVNVVAHALRLSPDNVASVIEGYDVVIDASDNFETRFMVNDACVRLGKPLVTGAVIGFEGQAMTVDPGRSACYRCVFEAPPATPSDVPSSAEIGVLGAVPGVVGALEATEAIKVITGSGEPLYDRLLTYDALAMRFRIVPLRRNPLCPACGGADPAARHLCRP